MRRTTARSLALPWLALGVLALAAAAPDASAQSVARGQRLYSDLGCDASNCHGVNPAENLRNVLNGAGSPATIEYAAVTRTEMNALYAALISDQTIAQDLAAWLRSVAASGPPAPPPVATGPTASVIEYFHTGFGHYFVTNIAGEIDALDTGRVAGWTRTGKSFKAFTTAVALTAPVCRFFTTAFAPRSSHFYTAIAGECASVRNGNPNWQYEGDAFHVPPADAAGACPAGSRAVYRLYNNGGSGAPNHRYTTESDVRAQMLAAGWQAEGFGALGVAFCAPD